MKNKTFHSFLQSALLSLLLMPMQGQALNISDTPLFLTGSVQPLVMLDISKDQQLYKKAYNDYSDLDGDGQIETTYKHSINYYGYFDSGKCYTYDSTDKRYEPASVSATKKCSGQWSGNFLNWASMARMDAVRKLLYGGLRSPDRSNGDGSGISDGDTATSTVLERVFLPNDAHSWAKYYDGDGGATISELTPYTPPNTTTASSTAIAITNDGSNTVTYVFTVASATDFATNDYVLVSADANNYLKGKITGISGSNITISVARANFAGSGSHSSWSLRNLSKSGITLCNTTLGGSSPQDKSQTNTNLPRLRVAKGNFSLWNANERWQCRWSAEIDARNSNDFDYSGVPAFGSATVNSNPTLATHGTGAGLGDYFVRVQACVPGMIGSEKCKQYPSGNFKPIGLLQVYGDPDQIHFGLMTGSYDNNISGGVLRKNVGTFTNEVNKDTDGTFKADIDAVASGVQIGIVGTLNNMRVYGYYYGDGTYHGSSGDNCIYQLVNPTENQCTSWGNPMSELYYESLRYFAGAGSATPAYIDEGSTKDSALRLPRPSWVQPLSNTNYCAPLNTLVFNASVSTNDFDLATDSMSAINSASTAAALANLVGTGEGVAGGSYFIGSAGTSGAANNELCDAKTVGNLGNIKGICPEGPGLLGSYLLPGLAYHARNNRIRTDLTVPADDTKSLKVATYGIQLATNVPRIPITLVGETTPRVILQPIYRLVKTGGNGSGALVDMKILDQTATATTAKGSIYLNWEDSEQGGDYDQDMWGVLRYCLTTVANGCGSGTAANTLRVTTDAIAASSFDPQGFGYTTSGTTQDGPHFHSGIYNFSYTDPANITVTGGAVNASGGCNSCAVGNTASTATYTLGGTVASELKDPLYYAAKWGGFNDLGTTPDGVPSSALEWDVLTTTGTPGSDGIPDNYFLVSNPLGLETALNSAFLKILRDASASAVATNSSTLNTGSRVFQGRFSSSFWSGQLLSYRLSAVTGQVIPALTPPPAWDSNDKPYPEWDAGQNIKAQASTGSDTRVILTRSSTGTSVDFTYSNLDSTQKGLLDLNSSTSQQDDCGPERVAFLRGHSVNEGTGSFGCAAHPTVPILKFRTRSVSILGDIINSNPSFVGPPAAGYSDVDHPGYSAFKTSFKDRTPVVYVGANDGMLHGFDVSVVSATNLPGANAGKEVLAYVPSPVFSNLSKLTDSNYVHKYFVDSSPMMADACVSTTSTCSSTWKTVLIGGLGAGGKGYYALNVTNPLDASKDTATTPMFNSSTNKANILMWEFTNDDDADLGLTYNTSPTKLTNNQAKQIVKFENGRWGVVLGNGYPNNITSGKAVLYVLFLSGPTGGTWTAGGVDYVKIVADAGTGNGLSTPIPFDSNGNGLADTVYAGDLKGNVWKFDLSNASPGSWAVAYSGAALFSAGASKPMTTPPEITLHPSGGSMVMIGTGKYLDDTDSASTSVQSFYGIHDNGGSVSASNLVKKVITTTTIGGDTYRLTEPGCDNLSVTVLPDCPASVKGWYMDLPTSGERVTGSPRLASGKLFFNTFIPSVTPCDFGGTGWLMAVDYLDGSTTADATFDTDGSNTVNATDISVAGVQVGAALGGTTLIKASPGTAAAAAAAAGAAAAAAAASAADAAASAAATAAGASSAAAAAAGAAAAAAAASGASAAATGAAASAAAIAAGATAAQAAAASAAAAAVISEAYTNAASEVAAVAIAPGGGAAVSSLTTGNTSSQQMSFGAGTVGRINWREIIQ